jgi:aminoglycoside phosphotransferase (APT) family kinase protein
MANDSVAPSFPPAEGRRMEWHDAPARLRSEIDARLGAPVVEARSQPGGFSPGLAVRVKTARGERVFLKAVCSSPNPESPIIHRREARIAAALPARAPAPRLHWSHNEDGWVVLAFDDIEGRTPQLPWKRDELERVLDALRALADALTPSPVQLESAAQRLAPLFRGWRSLAADVAGHAGLDPTVREHLDELVELEARALDATTGTSLVHLDIRADNILLTDDQVFFVDWPWAAIGARWLDLMAMLPSVAMQGGPEPEPLWNAHPLSGGVDRADADAVLAALAGFFTYASMQPDSPGLPTLRAFQAGQGEVARRWIAERRGWLP